MDNFTHPINQSTVSRRYSGRRSSLPIWNLLISEKNRQRSISLLLLSAGKAGSQLISSSDQPPSEKLPVTHRDALHNPQRTSLYALAQKLHAIILVSDRLHACTNNMKSSYLFGHLMFALCPQMIIGDTSCCHCD